MTRSIRGSLLQVLVVATMAGHTTACDPLLEIPPDAGPDSGPAGDGLPEASTFQCAGVAGTPLRCIDFNDGQAPGIVPEGGEFEVVGGRYVGNGPPTPPSTCGDSLMTHAMVTGLNVTDVRVSMQLASVDRVDKVLVLRSSDAQNRIQINFRAHDEAGDFGDVMVQELRDCVFSKLTADGEIPLDHELGQKIDVVAELVGSHLRVHADGALLVDRDFAVQTAGGEVGMAIIDRSRTVFDDIVIEDAAGGG